MDNNRYLNWKWPEYWPYKIDWDSPEWLRCMAEVRKDTDERLEEFGFTVCPQCGKEYAPRVVRCWTCGLRSTPEQIIAVDFDDTCVDNAFPQVGKDKDYAVQVLRLLAEKGHQLILWTCREDHATDLRKQYLRDAVIWFAERRIPLAGVNFVPADSDPFADYPRNRAFSKLYANIYIDDKAYGVHEKGINWVEICQTLLGNEGFLKLFVSRLDE